MEKIFILAEKENWITDELEREWINYVTNNNDLKEKYQYTNSIINADIIWILSDYIVHRVPKELFLSKRVITTIHHIVPWKMDQNKINHFKYLDEISNEFMTIESKCCNELKKYVTKPIKVIPFWHNENVWFPLRNKQTELRNKYNIPNNNNTFIIGSFQKDTEGAGIEKGIIKPKLEKGPDLFIEAVKKYKEYKKQTNINICVILTGYRRHYVINELKKLDIPYIYIQMCDFKTLNECLFNNTTSISVSGLTMTDCRIYTEMVYLPKDERVIYLNTKEYDYLIEQKQYFTYSVEAGQIHKNIKFN